MAQSLRVRVPRAVYNQVREDLVRPHPHAEERVGFLSTTLKTNADGTNLLLVTGYHPVPDWHYVPDSTVGARISTSAIRTALQRVLDTRQGAFHVHLHEHVGIPQLSWTDRQELPHLVESLRVVGPAQAHGIFLLSDDACTSCVWLPDANQPITPDLITVVGFPMEFIKPQGGPQACPDDRFARQSFLGPHAQSLVETARVGIIGLGGGGSHIVQQLAHVGVRYFTCFDDDAVEATNLNRLVGAVASDPADRTPKVEIARRVILSLSPEAEIVTHQGKWQERPDLLNQCDLVFGCVDTFSGRRDLEAECRRYLIPYIDIGMDVHKVGDEPPRMAGQLILSLPGRPCMHCVGFLNEHNLAQEAARYGAAGARPQVIWPNGVLASSAVGLGIELLTGWTQRQDELIYLSYDGNQSTLKAHPRLQYLNVQACDHYPSSQVGPPIWS